MVPEEPWEAVKIRRGCRVSSRSEVAPLPTNKVFLLQDKCAGDCSRTDGGPLPKSKILMIGGSQVRYLDYVFCSWDRRNRTRVCFLIVCVREVGDRVARVMSGEGAVPIVF